MLHRILSSGANLHKWKIRNISVCDACIKIKPSVWRQKGLTGSCFKYIDRPFCLRTNKTIIHLLFECKHVERLWTHVGEALGMNISQDFVVCGSMDGNIYGSNIVITLVCFLIRQ